MLSENVRIGSTLLQTAADLKLSRVIYTSSCQVYGLWDQPFGAVPKYLPFDETHPLNPHNVYALSKATNESFAKLVAARQGTSTAIFRLPWVPHWDYSPAWDEELQKKPKITDGFATYCHVTDVAKAFVLAVENPRPGCEVYQFSADEIWSIVPLAQRLREHHPDFPSLPNDWAGGALKSPLITQKAAPGSFWLDADLECAGFLSPAARIDHD